MNDFFTIVGSVFVISFVWGILDLGRQYIAILKYDSDIRHNRNVENSENNENENNENEDNGREINIINIIPMSNNHIPSVVLEHFIELFIGENTRALNDNKPPSICIPDGFDENDIPDEFKCPISRMIMKDPVIAGDGHTYEREQMETHISNRLTSPVTNRELPFPYLITNWNLRKSIESYINSVNQNVNLELSDSSDSSDSDESDEASETNENEKIRKFDNEIKSLINALE